MTDQNMVERVARAFHAGTLYAPWDEMPPEARADFMGHARRALQAMREPTEAMVRTGGTMFDANIYMGGASQRGKDKAADCFRAMIDAALSESQPPAPKQTEGEKGVSIAPEAACDICKGSGMTGWEKPMGNPPTMVFVPQICNCDFGRALQAALNQAGEKP